MGAAEIKTGAPAAQWSAVLGTGHMRLYGTTAIPTGLYRFSDSAHSGVLSLNFGVISRLTWLDSEGHEGFLGAEGGIMVIGLANSTSDTRQVVDAGRRRVRPGRERADREPLHDHAGVDQPARLGRGRHHARRLRRTRAGVTP